VGLHAAAKGVVAVVEAVLAGVGLFGEAIEAVVLVVAVAAEGVGHTFQAAPRGVAMRDTDRGRPFHTLRALASVVLGSIASVVLDDTLEQAGLRVAEFEAAALALRIGLDHCEQAPAGIVLELDLAFGREHAVE